MNTSSKAVKVITRIGSTLLAFAVIKFFGPIPGLIVFGVYFLLENKFGAVYSLIISVIVGFASLIFLTKSLNGYLFGNKNTNHTYNSLPHNQLDKDRDYVVSFISSVAPKNVDNTTTLTGASRLGNQFHYYYNVKNLNPNILISREFTIEMHNIGITNYCGKSMESVRTLFPGGVIHNYHDNQGNKSVISFYPYECNYK